MPFLLRYGSRDTRRVDFSRVDGLSMNLWVLGCHTSSMIESKKIISSRFRGRIVVEPRPEKSLFKDLTSLIQFLKY